MTSHLALLIVGNICCASAIILIKASGEFVLNVPSWDLSKQTKYCGTVSGHDIDKLAQTGLHEAEPRAVRPPLIEECIGHLECAVVDVLTPGDHAVFTAEVVVAWAESEAFDEAWKLEEKELKPLLHLGASYYAVPEERIELT